MVYFFVLFFLFSCSFNNPFLTSNYFKDTRWFNSSEPQIQLSFRYDNEFIYFSIKGECVDSVNKILYFVCNIEEKKDQGVNFLENIQWFEGSRINFPYKISKIYMIKGYTNPPILKLTRRWEESKWISEPNNLEPNAKVDELYQNTDIVNKITEVKIRRSYLGNPKKRLYFNIYFKDLTKNSGYGEIYAVAGHNSSINGGGEKTFTKYYQVDLSKSGDIPALKP